MRIVEEVEVDVAKPRGRPKNSLRRTIEDLKKKCLC